MTIFNFRATTIIDTNYSYHIKVAKLCSLINHMGFISCHIMSLGITSLGGGKADSHKSLNQSSNGYGV